MNIDKAKNLAKKLQRKAESAEKIGNPEEAMAFAAKAFELADKYGFDIEDVKEQEFVTYPFTEAKYYQMQFVARIAKLYGVAPILSHYKKANGATAYVYLHGKQDMIDMVVTMFEHSEPILRKIMNSELKDYRARYEAAKTELVEEHGATVEQAEATLKQYFVRDKRFRQDFFTGVGRGISDRVEKAREQYARELSAVMSLSAETALADYAKDHKVGKTSSSIGSSQAFNAGKNAAGAVSQGAQIGGIKFIG